jgi:hypothetical protein
MKSIDKNYNMYIYNITIKVAKHITTDWLIWMKENHIPAVMATTCFTHFKMLQLLDIDYSEGPTYAIQYFCATLENYENYLTNHAETLKQESYKKWGDAFIAFRTLMIEVD